MQALIFPNSHTIFPMILLSSILPNNYFSIYLSLQISNTSSSPTFSAHCFPSYFTKKKPHTKPKTTCWVQALLLRRGPLWTPGTGRRYKQPLVYGTCFIAEKGAIVNTAAIHWLVSSTFYINSNKRLLAK